MPDRESAQGLGDDRTDLVELTRTLTEGAARGDVASIARGARFGRYLVVDVIGSGGMGVVYLAEQVEPIRRLVAIKLMPQGLLSPERRLRFDIERQALARMSHPGIAQILDAGATPEGLPWFVMEHVEGLPLDQWIAQQQPDLGRRLALLRDVARAVAHAHQRGLLHCDLKPSNILVTQVDGRPVPKLIDFGIARTLGARGTGSSAGTPGYMSPEQAREGGGLDIRSDVFSLGVLLFEVIAGKPYRAWHREWPVGLPEAVQRIAEELPRRPSEAAASPLPRARELDAIVLRALQPDRENRYASAEALAEEVQRWLDQRPLQAMPADRGYRLRCFLRRHALASATGALAGLAVVGGLAGTSYGLVEARAQRAHAEQRQAELEKVVAFQQRALGSMDFTAMGDALVQALLDGAEHAAENRGVAPDAVARLRAELGERLREAAPTDAARGLVRDQILKPAGSLIDREYASGDTVEAALRLALAEVYMPQTLLDEAERQLQRALEIRRRLLGETDPRTIEARFAEVNLLWWRGRFDTAVEHAAGVSSDCDRVIGKQVYLCRRALRAKGLLLHRAGKTEQALPLLEELEQRQREADGPLHPNSLQALANHLELRANHEQVCQPDVKRRLGDVLGELPTSDDRRLIRISLLELSGTCHYLDSEFPLAAARYAEVFALQQALHGFDHQLTRASAVSLAGMQARAGQVQEARRLIDNVRAAIASSDGRDHPNLRSTESALALVASAEGNHDEAVAASGRLLASALAQHDAGHPYAMFARLTHAEILQRAQRSTQALAELDALRAAFSSTAAAVRLERLWAETIEIEARTGLGEPLRVGQAEAVLSDLLDLVVPSHVLVTRVAEVLHAQLRARGDAEAAARVREARLDWLLTADPDRIGADQRAARERLAATLPPGG